MNSNVAVSNEYDPYRKIATAILREPNKTIRGLFRTLDGAVKTQVVQYPPPPTMYFPMVRVAALLNKHEGGDARRYKLIGIQFEETIWKEWVAVYEEDL